MLNWLKETYLRFRYPMVTIDDPRQEYEESARKHLHDSAEADLDARVVQLVNTEILQPTIMVNDEEIQKGLKISVRETAKEVETAE